MLNTLLCTCLHGNQCKSSLWLTNLEDTYFFHIDTYFLNHSYVNFYYSEHSKATFTYAGSGCGAETGGFWHSRCATAGMFTHTRSGGGRICHFLRIKMVWSARFRSRRGKLGVGPICCGVDFAPTPPPLRDRVCVNACNDLCWSQFFARVRSTHVWTYL